MNARRINGARKPVDAVLRAMPSKSVTHRALVAAALAGGGSTIHEPLVADDTCITRDGLRELGIEIRSDSDRWVVSGCGGAPRGGGVLSLGESGTSMRFLTAVAAIGGEPSKLDGAPRLRERPMRELASALQALGGSIELGPSDGGLPLRAGGGTLRGGRASLPSDRSSQFASALLLIGSRLPGGIDLTLEPPAVSLPYVVVTERVLADFGVAIERLGERRWQVRPGDYPGREYRVEGDHSSASYFLAAAAVVGGKVRVDGLVPSSAQPDARLGSILEQIGCRVATGPDWVEVEGSGRIPAFDLNMSEAPDLVPTVAILALFADGPCSLSAISHLRHKESDRLEVLARSLEVLGRRTEVTEDVLRIGAMPPRLEAGRISTESDHRMAMAFAIAGLRIPGVELADPDCVSKSNPSFWRQFGELEG